MGYMRHHAIIVTSWNPIRIREARDRAVTLFGKTVSPVVPSSINEYESFFVAPDGSKEGWSESDKGDEERAVFVSWLDAQRYDDHSTWFSWVVVQYGDDEGETRIDRHSDEHVPQEAEAARSGTIS